MSFATKQQIQNAREPDLLTFLQHYHPDDLVSIGPGAFKLKSHDSLKISNGKWCWWSHDKMGGVNALEYLIKVENMSFPQAVQLVNEQCGFSSFSEPSRSVSRASTVPREKTEFLLPVRSPNNRRVTAYLLSRGIDIEILDYCYQNGLLYEDAEHHNAVFVGYDGATPKYATLRGSTTGSIFKREVVGSSKAYCFSIPASAPGAVLNVFECAIDALSYLTQLKQQGQDWHSQSVLSLGGVYQPKKRDAAPTMPVALKGYLTAHRDVTEIVLRLDNDPVGRSAAQAIRVTVETLTVTIQYPKQGKDYNEWLMLQKGISPRQNARNEPER